MKAFPAAAGVSAIVFCLATGSTSAQTASQTQVTPVPQQGDGAVAPSSAQATSGAGSSDQAIGDVVVTAERRSQSIQRSSLAIEVFSGASLREAGVNQARDLTKLSPGVLIGQGGAATQIYIAVSAISPPRRSRTRRSRSTSTACMSRARNRSKAISSIWSGSRCSRVRRARYTAATPAAAR